MNFVQREKDPLITSLHNNVMQQMQNIVNPNQANIQKNNDQSLSLDNAAVEAQNNVKAAMQELLTLLNNPTT